MRLLNKDTSPHYLPSVELDGSRRAPELTLLPKVPSDDIGDAHLAALMKHPTFALYVEIRRIVDADREMAIERERREAPGKQHAKELATRDQRIRELEAQLAETKKPETKKS